jgi:sugar lactone lactonase YvrE
MRIGVACFVVCVGLFVVPLGAAATVPVATVVSLDPAANEFTEGLTIDRRGNVYVGLAFQGRILKIAPDGRRSTFATLPIGSGLLIGLAVDAADSVYAAVDSFDPATQGIWRVSSARAAPIRVAALDPTGFPNGLAFDRQGDLFVTDSSLGTIWRISRFGGAATAWLSSPLLAGDPSLSGIGANGIAFWHGDVYVANSDRMSIVRVPVNRDGSAGTPRVYVADPAIGFADGIAFDARGSLYVASSFTSNTLVRIAPDRTIQLLATAADGLDYTASVAFGRSHGDRTKLYFTNAGVNFGTPSVMTADVGVAGNREDDR